jgi:small conductance mechanosensitive channel
MNSVNAWKELYSGLLAHMPALVGLILIALVLWGANWWLLRRRPEMGAEQRFPRQLLMFLLFLTALLVLILLIPMSDTTRGQILSLLGIVLTAVIALSSTTLVSNAMAGLMLRLVKSFRPGDFIRINELFGRVTQRGLFHTEIQTEDRDLTTIPNLFIVTHPVTVVRSSGTIISASVSLGYDVPRERVEDLLKRAAEEATLEEPFLQVRELGDFSVTYRIAGFLPDVKQLLTARSNLRKQMLDALHGDGIEIVSPTFMNQRQIAADKRFIPPKEFPQPGPPVVEEAPEAIMFDKAEQAERLEKLRYQHEQLQKQIAELEESRKTAPEGSQADIDHQVSHLQREADAMMNELKGMEKKEQTPDEPGP